MVAIIAGVHIGQKGGNDKIGSNWLKENFLVLLEIYEYKIDYDLAKTPFYWLPHFGHYLIVGSLSRGNCGTLIGHHEAWVTVVITTVPKNIVDYTNLKADAVLQDSNK